MARELWDLIPGHWHADLEICHAEILKISQLLAASGNTDEVVVPVRENIFAALKLAPEQVKVVILGQDPYPNSNHAIGLAFAVPRGTSPLPGSLRNIFKEVHSDLGRESFSAPDLEHWVSQGVLLLNTSLTTLAGASNSHASYPWSQITSQILNAVLRCNPNVVAILWGKSAQSYVSNFARDRVIMSAHPSPLSAHRGFLGSGPFSKANDLLSMDNQERISW